MFGARVFSNDGSILLDSEQRGLGLHATGTLTTANTANHIAEITYPATATGSILLFKPPVTGRYMTVGIVQETITRFIIEAGGDTFVMPWMILSPGVVANTAQFGIRTFNSSGQLSFSTEQIVPGVKGLTNVSWQDQAVNWPNWAEVDDNISGATMNDWICYMQPGLLAYLLFTNQFNAFDIYGAYGKIRRINDSVFRKRLSFLDISVIPANRQPFPFNETGNDLLGTLLTPPINYFLLNGTRQQNVVVFAG
jgi:hypothetical protein